MMAKNVIVEGLPIVVPVAYRLLDAIHEAGRHVPTLCHDPRLAPRGTCGICVVEIRTSTGTDWEKVPACATSVEGVEEVRIRSSSLEQSRRLTLELLLSRHSEDARFYPDRLKGGRRPPMVCACRGHPSCVLRSVCLDVQFMPSGRPREAVDAQPVLLRPGIEFDLSKCVLCDRCVRICRDVRRVEALSFVGRGYETSLTYAEPVDSTARSECDACERNGALCIDTCPTDALRRPRHPRLTVVE